MSGGSLNYISYNLEEVAPRLLDPEIIDLALDFAKLLHEAEWYLSGDTGEGDYNIALDNFKNKWFKKSRKDRLEQYINDSFVKNRDELLKMIGTAKRCKDCESYYPAEAMKSDLYGNCKHKRHCLQHQEDWACELFEERKKC